MLIIISMRCKRTQQKVIRLIKTSMISLKILVPFLLYFILSIQIHAQPSNINFEHFGYEKGLPSAVVPSVFQDRIGYIWFGTFHGIARYDGYSIVAYTHREVDTTSISNAIIDAFCNDSDGNLWVGHARGLDKFNYSTETFTHYTLNSVLPSTDWSQHVISLLEDKNDTLWIGTGDGLYIFNKLTETFTWIKHDSTNPYSISSTNINAIYEDRSGSLWFGTGKGLNEYDKESKRFIHYWYPTEKYKDIENNNNPYWLCSILEDREGIFWLGTTGGVVEFNRQTEEFTLFQHDSKNSESLADNIVLSICEDQSGLLWISTKDGLDIFNKKTKIFSHYKHVVENPSSIGSNDVAKIILDRSGTIWISLYGGGGVEKFTPPNPLFKQYNLEPVKNNGASSIYTNNIGEDNNGMIWIGTQNGLFKFDPVNEIINKKIYNRDITFISVDEAGSFWVSAWNEGIYKLNQNDLQNSINNSKNLILKENISSIYKCQSGKILLGCSMGNIYSLNSVSGKINLIVHYPVWVEAVYEDKSGVLWIGSREEGIIWYDPLQKKFTQYTYDPKDSLTIGGNNVTQFCEDRNGDIWIIASSTLNKYSRAEGKIRRMGGKGNFPDDVFHIIEDDGGNLWFCTPNGTKKYDLETNQFKNYRNLMGWGYKARDGELYIGFNNITRFYPDSLKDNSFIPPIVITSFRKFEKPYPFGKTIELNYTDNFLSFEFSALSYISPEKNQYAYKMEGVDKDWVYSGTRRFASYPNLEPGNYIFKVKGSNNDGVWNEEGTSIAIIISPPFWKTWWAYSLYAGIFIFALYGIRRYEMNRMSYKNQGKLDKAVLKEKEETDKIKSDFFANISHEFRTPLTLILGPAEKIEKNESTNPAKDASIITRNSKRLLQLVNQLLDLSKLEAGKLKLEASKGNIVSFVKGIVLSFESLSESKDITLKISADKEFIELYFDKEKMIKILTNLLSNSFKFTPEGGKIIVSISEKNYAGKAGTLEIKIRDTGIGIAPEEMPKLFDRFYQVDSSQTREFEGTGIGLALTKELVELHQGNISVESEKGSADKDGKGLPAGQAGWTEFTLEFPLGRNHLKDEDVLKAEALFDETVILLDDEKYFIPKDVEEEFAGELSENKYLILVVEDNYDMREYIKESLSESYIG